jgi:hypothetical protein
LQLKQYNESRVQSEYLKRIQTGDEKKFDREGYADALVAKQDIIQYLPYNNPSLWMPSKP